MSGTRTHGGERPLPAERRSATQSTLGTQRLSPSNGGAEAGWGRGGAEAGRDGGGARRRRGAAEAGQRRGGRSVAVAVLEAAVGGAVRSRPFPLTIPAHDPVRVPGTCGSFPGSVPAAARVRAAGHGRRRPLAPAGSQEQDMEQLLCQRAFRDPSIPTNPTLDIAPYKFLQLTADPEELINY